MNTEVEITSAEEVLRLLSQGQELRNRGTGWWIAAPQVAYKSSASQKVADDVVKSLESDRRIKISLPDRSLIAELVPAAK